VSEHTVADLGIEESQVGFGGARQEVVSVQAAEARSSGEIIVDEGDAHERIVSFLEQIKVL
jgi:electron transfer flavoprotein beta subunit